MGSVVVLKKRHGRGFSTLRVQSDDRILQAGYRVPPGAVNNMQNR